MIKKIHAWFLRKDYSSLVFPFVMVFIQFIFLIAAYSVYQWLSIAFAIIFIHLPITLIYPILVAAYQLKRSENYGFLLPFAGMVLNGIFLLAFVLFLGFLYTGKIAATTF